MRGNYNATKLQDQKRGEGGRAGQPPCGSGITFGKPIRSFLSCRETFAASLRHLSLIMLTALTCSKDRE